MKVLLAVLTVTAMSMAQDKPCWIVQAVQGNRLNGLASAGVFGLALAHGERFPYLESQSLPARDIKDQYKREELEKLESKGVKI